MHQKLAKSDHQPVIKIVGVYTLFGTLWIYFSDTILGWMVRDPDLMTKIAIYKGMMYIFLTAVLLYALIYRHVYQNTLTRKKIEASEEFFSKVFKNAPVMMMINERDNGAYLDVNQIFSQLSGFNREEVIAKTPVELAWITSEEWEKINQVLKQDGHCSGLEIKTTSKNGQSIECQYYGEPITVDGQQRLLSIMLDVTGQKKLEKQLLQAHKMESIGRLAGGVAHDFNNKLAVILGYAEIAKIKLSEDSLLWQQLDEITTAALHSRDITRQLLAFSRQDIISPKPVNLNIAIKNSQNALSLLIGEDIIFSFLPGNDLWQVKIDPVQIDQIVMNLAVNARDAMPDGGSFSIATTNIHITELNHPDYVEAKPGDYICVSFTDSGSGMNKETLRNIFEPFYTTKEVGKGTGLGLATIYGIVSQNSGFIDVFSQTGQGTTFNIYLPKLVDETVSELPAKTVDESGSGTILVVEDEEGVRKMINVMLQQHGYKVITVATPLEAIELFRNDSFNLDLVLSDVIMPGMSGREMMQVIDSVRNGVKVLFMSGYTSDIISQKGILENKVNFIQKPFNTSILNETIKKVLAQQ